MTVSKFGSHLRGSKDLTYFSILPMILKHSLKSIKLSNGDEIRCYGINGDDTTLLFPFPASEVYGVHCNQQIQIVINNSAFSVSDLIGYKLVSGDIISVIKPSKTAQSSLIPAYLGLILKSKIQDE